MDIISFYLFPNFKMAGQVEDVEGHEASATRTVSDAGSADPLGASQQTLVVCSVLQVRGRRQVLS
jgi:hypothetical protein